MWRALQKFLGSIFFALITVVAATPSSKTAQSPPQWAKFAMKNAVY
jgi:hypothetical protein